MSASPPPKKYIFVNGVMQKNPAFEALQGHSSKEKSHANELAVISSSNDLEEAKALQQTLGNVEVEIQYVPTTAAAISTFQSESHQEFFFNPSAPPVQSRNLLQELFDYFIIYEVPIGLVTKLLELENYRLNFMVDDSGSMMSETDVTFGESCAFMKQNFPHENPNKLMTRILEEENRLHVMMDILSYVAVQNIQIFFMNTNVTLHFSNRGKLPEVFREEVHNSIREVFSRLSFGGTPTMKILKRSLEDAAKNASYPTAHYLLTDGVPSDASTSQVADVIKTRAHPERNPLTLISCTNVDSECEWMKTIEEIAPFCAEVDDYNDEREEVMKDQGKAFPYTKGMWLLSNLVAAINPHDLDAMDEDIPFTKFTLDGLLGVSTSLADYEYYFRNNPHSHHYKHLFEQFLTREVHAHEIVSKRDQQKNRSASAPHKSESFCVVM